MGSLEGRVANLILELAGAGLPLFSESDLPLCQKIKFGVNHYLVNGCHKKQSMLRIQKIGHAV